MRNYPTPQMVRQMVNGRRPFPSDPDRKLMLTRLMEKFEQRQAEGGDANAASAIPTWRTRKSLVELLGPRRSERFRAGHARSSVSKAFESLPRERQDGVIGAMPPGLRQGLLPSRRPNCAAARDG